MMMVMTWRWWWLLWWWYAWILILTQLSNCSQPSVHMQSGNPRHLFWTKMVITVLIVIPVHMQSGGTAIHFGPKTSWCSHILFSKTSWSLVFSNIVLRDIMVIIVHHDLCSYAKKNSEAPRHHPFTLDSHCHNHHHQFLLVAFSEIYLSATDLIDVDAHVVRWNKILRHGL